MQSSLFPKRKLLACVSFLIACLAAWPTSAWAQVTNATQGTNFTDLQAAIDAATNGDVIAIDAGTLTPDGTITIDKPLSIQGAGSALTTIDIGGFNAWGIYITASNSFPSASVSSSAVRNSSKVHCIEPKVTSFDEKSITALK